MLVEGNPIPNVTSELTTDHPAPESSEHLPDPVFPILEGDHLLIQGVEGIIPCTVQLGFGHHELPAIKPCNPDDLLHPEQRHLRRPTDVEIRMQRGRRSVV